MSWKYSGVGIRFTRFESQPNDNEKASFDNFASLIMSNDEEGIREILKNKRIQTEDGDQLTVLHVAARWAERGALAALLADRRVLALMERVMYNGDTPLLAAARHGNAVAAALLLASGADAAAREPRAGRTALHLAAIAPRDDLARALLDAPATAAIIDDVDSFGDTALQVGVREHSPTSQLLLQAGADCAKANAFTGRTVMHTAVAYDRCDLAAELLAGGPRRLADAADRRGDTPLMLALRLGCRRCAEALTATLRPGAEVNETTGESVLHLAVEADDDELVRHVLVCARQDVVGHADAEGRTALLYAVERHKNACLERLFRSQSLKARNALTGDTVLHVALRVDNVAALKILFRPAHAVASAWCLAQPNANGKTPLWLAVESDHSRFVAEARTAGLVDVGERNRLGDSLFYVAAAEGNLSVLKALLLSDRYYNFCRLHQREADSKRADLSRNTVICCDVFDTDMFVLTGTGRPYQLDNKWVPAAFLEPNRQTGRNVYHACCVGGSPECLGFVHSYFVQFELDRTQFDRRDKEGNTPLLLATRNDTECVRCLLADGANITSTNLSGESVLASFLANAEDPTGELQEVLSRGILYDPTAIGLQEGSECLKIDFTLFRPPEEPVTKVVKLFYETVHGPRRSELLQHTLFKVYVHLILVSIDYFFTIRFILSCVSTFLLSMHIIFYSDPKLYLLQAGFFYGTRHVLTVSSVFGILFSVPILYHHSSLTVGLTTYALTLLPGVLVICLAQLPFDSKFTFEIAALTVLVSWASLLMYSTALFKDISNQITMLSQVIKGMLIYFRIVVIILLPFSLTFFCVFRHDSFFVTLGKSFFYTSFILLQGDTVDTVLSFETKHFSQGNSSNITATDAQETSSYLETKLDLVFESAFLFVFTITCVLGLLNMLVGLAVRDGHTLAADGEVYRRNLQIHWLNSLEMFLNSFIYKVLKWTKLIFLFGIIPSKTHIDVEVRYSPMVDRKSYVFSSIFLIEMKKSVVKSEGSYGGKYSRSHKSSVLMKHSMKHEDRMSGNEDRIRRRTTKVGKED